MDCIRNHKTPLINLKWHRETIQAMLGCYESIQSGRIAKVDGAVPTPPLRNPRKIWYNTTISKTKELKDYGRKA